MEHAASKPLMTRKELAAFLRAQGYPIGNSTLDKLCMPSAYEGPPVARLWGKRKLYAPEDGIAWAQARSQPA
jgi:hypothetical protein